MGTSTEDREGVREEAVDKAEEKLEEADEGKDPEEAANGAVDTIKDTIKEGTKAGGQGLLKAVVSAAKEAAQEVLEREAKAGAKQAAEYLSQKAPELAKEQIEKHGGGGPAAKAAANFGKSKLEGAGGVKAIASGAGGALGGVAEKAKDAVSNILPGGGGDGDSSKGTRRLPVMYSIDIGVPVERAYNEWTQFEESPEYMHRLQSVDNDDPTRLKVTAKVWGIKRSWDAEIVEQIPNERIEWKTKGGTNHHGVVTFHALDDHLTRVLLTLDFPPDGIIEKMGSGLRIIRRAAIGDLKRFKAQLEMRDEERGAWRGRIEEGDVVSSEEDEEEPEGREDEEPEAAEEEEPEAAEDEEYDEPEAEEEPAEEDEEEEYEDEPEAEEEPAEEDEEDEEPEASEEEEEPEAEEPEEEEPKRPQPRRRRSTASKSSGSGSKSSSSRSRSSGSRSKSSSSRSKSSSSRSRSKA